MDNYVVIMNLVARVEKDAGLNEEAPGREPANIFKSKGLPP